MLTVATWVWGTKYGPEYLERLQAGVKRHLTLPHRFMVFEPSPEDMHLTEIPGCLVRLRMWDHHWQQSHGIYVDDQIVCMDLDSIVTGSLDDVFRRDEPFVILQGANSSNPCPFNGSLWSLRGGYRPDVWFDLSINAVAKAPYYEFPDDQSWMAYKLPDAAAWRAGPESGVLAYAKPGWPKGTELPDNARLVVFPGWRDPSKFTHLAWVRKFWLQKI